MPQLDKVTFLGQFFWTTVLFFSLYFVLLKFFLPKLSKILKYRERKFISSSQESSSPLFKEIFLISTTCEKLLSTAFQQGVLIINNIVFDFTQWVLDGSHRLQETEYKKSNKNFLLGLSEISISEKLQSSQPLQPSSSLGDILETWQVLDAVRV
jgi:Plant ATP synthase F0